VTVWWVLFFVAVGIACVLALLGVVWAVRAAINSIEGGPPAWWAVLPAAAALLAVPAGAAAIYFLVPVPITESTLAHSIERETDALTLYSSASCSEQMGTVWRCDVPEISDSGTVEYAVAVGDQCWHATLRTEGAAGQMPARADGCATLRDTGVLD
jgi:hypothetical protein